MPRKDHFSEVRLNEEAYDALKLILQGIDQNFRINEDESGEYINMDQIRIRKAPSGSTLEPDRPK